MKPVKLKEFTVIRFEDYDKDYCIERAENLMRWEKDKYPNSRRTEPVFDPKCIPIGQPHKTRGAWVITINFV